MSKFKSSANMSFQDRQWDARFNLQTEESYEEFITEIKKFAEEGKFNYCLVGGFEIGENSHQDDFGIRHVHCAFMFRNRISKSAILKRFKIKIGNGYYLVPRNRDLPFSGWRKHHTKSSTKVDTENVVLFEHGTLPPDNNAKYVLRSEEEKKRKIDDILLDLTSMINQDQCEEAYKKYPRTYLQYGEKIKALQFQRKDFFKTNGDPHIWVHGFPGSGKTALMQFVYPKNYKKPLENRFFDLYDPKQHNHVILEDVDPDAVERLGIQFFKTICDEAGFPIDQKYKTPQIVRTTVIATSNYTIDEILPNDLKGIEMTKQAFYRRYFHVRIDELLRICGVKLIPPFDRKRYKQEGNQDVGKLFLPYDYARDIYTGEALRDPDHYQKLIKEAYYK